MTSEKPEITVHVAGIVRGLIEHQDPYRHFGSLGAFKWHLDEAKKLGFVEDGPDDSLRVTEAGVDFYNKYKLKELPDGRANGWTLQEV